MRYQKLFAFNAPILTAVIAVALVLFFCLEGKGFQSDSFHQAIFFSALVVVAVGATVGYRKTKERLAEINSNLEELKKFELE